MRKKYVLPIILFIVSFALIIGVFFSTRSSSNSSISIEKFISSQNGNLGVKQIIAITEASDTFDLVFYYTSNGQIAANLLVKDEDGQYTELVMTTTQSLNDRNQVFASSRVAYLSENTLYWGIAQSPDWTINHPNAHQIAVDELILGYYLHDKSLDEETLDLKFVHSES